MTLNITGVLVILVVIISIGLAAHYSDPWWFGMFAIPTTGLITFFGLIRYELNESNSRQLTSAVLRLAIASALTVAYLVMVAFTMFTTKEFEPSALSTQMVGSFTAVVGTVIAFFFGVSGYIDAQAKRQSKDAAADVETRPKSDS